MLNNIKIFLLRLLTPIQKLLQKSGPQETLITEEEVNLIKSLIRPGDILLTRENQHPTGIFIKGKYKHAAIQSIRNTVVEAVGDNFKIDKATGVKTNLGGVREVPLEKFLYGKDAVALIRPSFAFDFANRAAANESLDYIGRNYDYTFSLSDSRIYCSELIYLCYSKFEKAFAAEIDHEDILPTEYLDLCFTTSYMHLIYETKRS